MQIILIKALYHAAEEFEFGLLHSLVLETILKVILQLFQLLGPQIIIWSFSKTTNLI